MTPKFAYFPMSSSPGFVVYQKPNESKHFVQILDEATSIITDFRRMDFSKEKLWPLPDSPNQEVGSLGLIVVGTKKLIDGSISFVDLKIEYAQCPFFNIEFFQSLENDLERKNYVNSFVREVGWSQLVSFANNDEDREYIVSYLSSFDFQLTGNNDVFFHDYSGKFKKEDKLIGQAIEGTKKYLLTQDIPSSAVDSLEDMKLYGKVEIHKRLRYIWSATKQEERIARLFLLLFKTENYQQRDQLLKAYRAQAIFAKDVIKFLITRIDESSDTLDFINNVSKHIPRFYQRAYWSTRHIFLVYICYYLREFSPSTSATRSLVSRSKAFTIRNNRQAYMDLLATPNSAWEDFLNNRHEPINLLN